jgi:hypothetical protein
MPPRRFATTGRWLFDCWMTYAHRTSDKSRFLARDIFTANIQVLAMP